MIDVLKLRVNKLIEENKDNKEILEKYKLIKEILNKDDLTVLAVSRYTIGVDIERITDYDFLIVKNFFNEEEKNIVKNSDFFRIFTLKESYIKMFDLKYDSFYKDDYNKYYNETIEYKDYIISYVVDCLT